MKKLFLVLFLLLSLNAFSAGGTGVRTVYSSTNVGTSNWLTLVSSVSQLTTQISITDTSGQTLELGICDANAPANSEVRQLIIPAGGIDAKMQILPGQRISIRAISGTASTGENDLTLVY